MSRVLTVGTFDLYHAGHVNFLYQCARIAGVHSDEHDEKHNVTVGLNSDAFIEHYKGTAPIYTYKERFKLLVNNRYVWNVIENDNKTIAPLLTTGGAYNTSIYDFLVIGSDWAKKDYYAQIGVSQAELDELGIILIYVPYTKGVSTTELKERIIRSG